MAPVGQLSDPYEQGEDEATGITISGLPGEPEPPRDAPPGDAADVDAAGDADDVDDEGAEVVFDLDDWSEMERRAVADHLREAGIPHGWEGTELHVAAVDSAPVDNILDLVEGELEPGLDPDRDQVAYDLTEWDDDQVTLLAEELDGAGIAFGWDGDELYVYADDEQATDEILERVSHPDELAVEPDTGTAGADMLGEIFVAADRLQHGGDDHEGSVTMLDMSQALDPAKPPYGLDPAEWKRLSERVRSLADLLRADEVDEDAVMEQARDLRTALRPFV
jgi:hypothetical protein